MTILTQTEEDTLKALDKLIDWHKENNRKVDHITISQRQFNALQRIAKKKLDKEIYRRVGDLEITQTHYRGVEFAIPVKPRRYRQRKDTDDFLSNGVKG